MPFVLVIDSPVLHWFSPCAVETILMVGGGPLVVEGDQLWSSRLSRGDKVKRHNWDQVALLYLVQGGEQCCCSMTDKGAWISVLNYVIPACRIVFFSKLKGGIPIYKTASLITFFQSSLLLTRTSNYFLFRETMWFITLRVTVHNHHHGCHTAWEVML